MTPEELNAEIDRIKASDLYLPIKMRRVRELMKQETTPELTPEQKRQNERLRSLQPESPILDSLIDELERNPGKVNKLRRAMGDF